MMLEWIARRAQVATLEQTVTALTDSLAQAHDRIEAANAHAASLSDRIDADADQIAALVQRIDRLETDAAARRTDHEALADRLADNEDRTRRVDDERSGTADYLDRMILRYDTAVEEVETLRTALSRLTNRFDLHAEDAIRTDAALLDRIERTRRPS